MKKVLDFEDTENVIDAEQNAEDVFDKSKARRVRIKGCLYYIPQGMSFKEWVEFRKEMGLSY